MTIERDQTFLEQQAEHYLWGDASARPGAANIGIGLALLALVEQMRGIRAALEDPPPVIAVSASVEFLKREVSRLQGEVMRERQLRQAAEAKGKEVTT